MVGLNMLGRLPYAGSGSIKRTFACIETVSRMMPCDVPSAYLITIDRIYGNVADMHDMGSGNYTAVTMQTRL